MKEEGGYGNGAIFSSGRKSWNFETLSTLHIRNFLEENFVPVNSQFIGELRPRRNNTLAVCAMANPLALKEDDLKLLLAARVHVGCENVNSHMEKYVWRRRQEDSPSHTLFTCAYYYSRI
ncbi:hypothetical protein AAMO2058_001167400 [Amorphochlora amoebiformis]